MRLIGITGGIGAGKTEVLSFIRQHYLCKICLADEVAQMEAQIDSLSADAPFRFVVPGTTLVEATLHLARTKARTAERRLWGLKGQYVIGDDVLMYLNRLSDYLFALATHYVG